MDNDKKHIWIQIDDKIDGNYYYKIHIGGYPTHEDILNMLVYMVTFVASSLLQTDPRNILEVIAKEIIEYEEQMGNFEND